MHDLLFANQDEWAGSGNHVAIFKAFAADLELPRVILMTVWTAIAMLKSSAPRSMKVCSWGSGDSLVFHQRSAVGWRATLFNIPTDNRHLATGPELAGPENYYASIPTLFVPGRHAFLD